MRLCLRLGACVVATDSKPLAARPTTTTRWFESTASDTLPQRNFKLERLTSAKRMEMIQKRTMIFGSGQPFFS